MTHPYIPVAKPSTGKDEWEATRECFDSGWLTQGPKVREFEKQFALRHRAAHAVAINSCTTGLHLALKVLGIGPGDEVLVPAFTWIATANVALYCGAKPVLVDVDELTYNLDPREVAKKITPRTRAIIPVHLFGLCADLEELARKVDLKNLHVVEDAACAAGASLRGKFAGTMGKIGVFSLHAKKIITTGEGGMLLTNDDKLAALAIQLRNHGAAIAEEVRHVAPQPYLLPDFKLLGFNYRMTDLQGAVGLVQLAKLDGFLTFRQKWAEFYREQLSSLGWLRPPAIPQEAVHSWQAFVCTVVPGKASLTRDELMEYLEKNGIASRPGTHAIHLLEYYKKEFGYAPDDFPQAKACHENTLALPMHNKMRPEDFQRVVDVLKGC